MTIQLNEVPKLLKIQEKYGDLDIVDMVHTFLTEEKEEEQEARIKAGRIGKFYPSSVGRCKRSIVYQMLGYPATPSKGQSLLVMDNGTYFHNRMEDIFERMGIMVAPELSLKDPVLRISGRSDAIIWNFMKSEDEPDGPEIVLREPLPADAKEGAEEQIVYQGPNNHILIVEFKSIKRQGFEKLKTMPKKEHEMQLQLYFYLTGIRKGIIYYECKNTQQTKFFIIEAKDELIENIVSDIKFILDHVDRHELPEKEGNIMDFMCHYCDYKNICHIPISQDEWMDQWLNNYLGEGTPNEKEEANEETFDIPAC